MLKRLAGRIEWEQVNDGGRVEIPAQWDWSVVAITIFMIVWTAGAWFYEENIVGDPPLIWFGRICAWAGTAGVALVLGWLAWAATGRTVVTVNPAELKIQRWVIGFLLATRSFAAFDIQNLRYIPPTPSYGYGTHKDPSYGKIQFEANHKTVRFARGITEREACALIDRMMQVYKFPKSLPCAPNG